jgi:plastocyanin
MRLALIAAPLVALSAVVAALAGPALAQEPTVTIAIKDHQFVPSEVPIPAGVRVELTIRNEQATPAEFESTALHREKVVPPGGSASVFVGPLQPGRYEFYDDFHPASRGFLVVR